jgi:hypothetical protein
MRRPRKTSFFVALKADWNEFRKAVGYWITFRKSRFSRVIRIWKVRRKDKPLVAAFRKRIRFRRWKKDHSVALAQKAKEVQSANSKSSIRRRWKFWLFQWKLPRKPFSVLVVRSLLVLMALAPLAIPVYYGLRIWRIDNFLDASVVALSNNELVTAWRTAHAAHLMKPDDIEILRALRNASGEANHPRSIEWSLKLVGHPEATDDDRLRFVELAVDRGKRELAEQQLAQLERNGASRMKTDYLRLILTLSRGQAAKPEAFALARTMLARGSATLETYRLYWSLCLDPSDPALANEGMSHLRQTAKHSDELGREALRQLLRTKAITENEYRDCARRLWQFPQPTRDDALLCINAAYFGRTLPIDKLRSLLAERFGPFSGPAETRKIAKVLSELGRPKTAEALLLSETNATRRASLLPELLRARILSKRHEKATVTLRDGNMSLSPSENLFFGSLLAQKSKKTEQAQALLARSFERATSSDLATIRQFIPLHDNPNAVVTLLERLEKDEHTPTGLRYLLATCYQRLGRNEALEKILARTPIPSSDTAPAAEQTCRLKTLYGQDLPACRRLAENLVTRHPATASYRYTLALCYLASGSPRDAHAILGPYLYATPPVCPSQRLVGAVTLAAVDRKADAIRWAPYAHKDLLLKPERILLATLPTPVKTLPSQQP